ncbi:MAG: DUF1631 domain-containing protein [Thiogranum sp.]
MSDSTKRNVVNLEDFGQMRRGLGSGAGTQALRGIRELASATLTRDLARMMEKIDDALFARAEKAENNMSQTLYFDAMRELRIIRKDIEDEFLSRFHDQFNQGIPRVSQFSTSFSLNWEDDDESGLGLVDKNDMEEDLAISNMVNKTRGNCKQSLYSLDKRIGLLINDPDLERWLNPLGPEAICAAFHEAARLIETGLEIRLVIFKLFDQHVISNIGELYKEINQYLVRMGVLPEIKTTLRKSGGPIIGPQSSPPTVANLPDSDTATMESTVLASSQAAGTGPAVFNPHSGGYAVSGPSSIHALTFLQQGELPPDGQTAYGGELGVNPADLASGQVNILHGMKNSALIQGFGKTGDMTIDIVAMLFDYILDDKNIPNSMRALIGRLQIPLLKIAFLDREFFSRKAHPARQLLNRLAATAVGWNEQQGDKDPLYLKVQSIVQTIVDEFDDDISLFETLLDDLETFIRKEEEQAVVRAERSAKVMEGQERLQVAKSTTLEEIEPHVNDQQNLDFIREFINTHWKNMLFVTCARQGKDSDAWKQAVTTMDRLIWSVKPKYTREERQQLVAMQPKLLNNLRDGMERLSIPPAERDDFIAKLVHAHGRTAVNEKAAEQALQPQQETATNAAVSQDIESQKVMAERETPKITEQAKTATGAEVSDAYTEKARQLASGDWMEFLGSDGKAKRAKLSWISPITNTYLFTDRQGLKAGNFTLDELAHLLRCARANILNGAPLMDRAVSTVLKEYKTH